VTQVFKSRMGSWRKALKSRAEFVFIDAPHILEDGESFDGESEEAQLGTCGRAWWKWEVRDLGPIKSCFPDVEAQDG
jgi:Serine hydrolase (FSH1)